MVRNFSFQIITPNMPRVNCSMTKKLIEELGTKTTDVLRNMCKQNPPSSQPTYKDEKADIIYKRAFGDFI